MDEGHAATIGLLIPDTDSNALARHEMIQGAGQALCLASEAKIRRHTTPTVAPKARMTGIER